jgi:hypothetical protein
MPILSSIVVWDQTQADGRRWVRERHTDQLGIAQFRDYLANVGVVIADGFPAIVAILNQALIDSEIQQNLVRIYEAGAAAVVTVQHATLADIRAALRVAYRTARREQAFALGAFLNTLTDAQLGTLFGVSGGALTALRTRLQTKAAQWTAYVAAAGE